MFNLLLPFGMKGLKTKTNWYISSKYLSISYNDQDTLLHATTILTHLLKLTKLLVLKIITKHTALKIIQFRLLGKCVVLRIFCFIAMLFSFIGIMKYKMTEKSKICLQNMIKISFLHIEKHNQNHIEVDIESHFEKDVLKTWERLTF